MDFSPKKYSKEYEKATIAFLEACLPESGRELDLNGRHSFYLDIPQYFCAFWVWFDGDAVIGTVGVRRLTAQDCELKSLYVLEKHHGKGYGRRLLEIAMGYAQQAGYRKMYLDSLSTSTRAVKLYREAGFKETARYNDAEHSDVFMVKELFAVKRIYHKEMEKILQEIPAGTVPKLLLHSCCGPCSTAVLEQLMPHFEIVLFYYNPNIAPREEFDRRLETQKQLLEQLEPPYPITLIAPPYDDAPFREAVKGVENTPEMGERCEKCIAQRMRESLAAAIKYKCDYFTTTLSVSPHKNAKFINTCGEEIAEGQTVKYLPADFKKGGGYARSVALSGEYHLYRQDYCGCPMSRLEAEARRAKREAKCRQERSESEETDAKTIQFMQMLADHELWLENYKKRYKRSLFSESGDPPSIEEVTVENLTLSGRNLVCVEMQGCTFKNCRFTDIDFFGSFLAGCRFIGCSFTHCIMGKSNMDNTFIQDTVFTDCTLIKTDFYESELSHVTFHHCDLTRAWFACAHAADVTLTDCDLSDCGLPKILHTEQDGDLYQK